MNRLFTEAKQLSFIDAKHMVIEIAENMGIEIPKIKSWSQIEAIIVELLNPAIDEAKKQEREIRRAKRFAAKEAFVDTLKPGQKFRLESSLLVEFVSVNERMLCESIVIDEDSLTWCVGDSYPVGVSELMKASLIDEMPESKLVKRQSKTFTFDNFRIDGGAGKLEVKVCYDDSCGNGYNSFGITGTLYRDDREYSCGAIHDDIRQFAPELAHLIKWHGMNSNNHEHMIANALYLASDKDCWGRRKGEVSRSDTRYLVDGCRIPLALNDKLYSWAMEHYKAGGGFKAVEVQHEKDPETYSSKWTIEGFSDGCQWYQCPFDDETTATAWCITFASNTHIEVIEIPTAYSAGKEPNLEAARNTAIWGDATIEQLQDEQLLRARLPSLVVQFKTVVESLGLIF